MLVVRLVRRRMVLGLLLRIRTTLKHVIGLMSVHASYLWKSLLWVRKMFKMERWKWGEYYVA